MQSRLAICGMGARTIRSRRQRPPGRPDRSADRWRAPFHSRLWVHRRASAATRNHRTPADRSSTAASKNRSALPGSFPRVIIGVRPGKSPNAPRHSLPYPALNPPDKRFDPVDGNVSPQIRASRTYTSGPSVPDVIESSSSRSSTPAATVVPLIHLVRKIGLFRTGIESL
jgi:hypothetical protein